MRKPVAALLVLVLALGGFAGLKLRAERIKRAEVPGGSIIYLPSGKFLRHAALGFTNLAADPNRSNDTARTAVEVVTETHHDVGATAILAPADTVDYGAIYKVKEFSTHAPIIMDYDIEI